MRTVIFKLYILLFFCMSALSVMASEWTTYYKSEQVEILYRYEDCHDEMNGIHQQKIFFKFINLGSQKLEVGFVRQISTERDSNANHDEKNFSVVLNAGETLQGECSVKNRALYLFSKQLNFSSSVLKQFSLQSISVRIIE